MARWGPNWSNPDGRLQEAGGLIFSDGSGWNFGRLGDPLDPAYMRPAEVDYCSGAALMVRNDLFRRLGGFDRRYAPAYYEDTDLCFGIRSLGYKVMYCPAATVIHFEGVTAGTDLASGFKRYQAINRDKFVAKWAADLVRQDPPPGQSGRVPVTADRHRLPASATDGSRPPHILIVDPLLPLHDRASGSLRLLRIILLLRALKWDVTYIARNGAGQEAYKEQLEGIGVKVYATDPERLAEAGHLHLAEPVDLERILAERPCQVAWLSFYYIAEQYLPLVRQFSPGTQVLVDTVDVHFLRETREAELAGDPAGMAKAAETRRRELAIYAQADRVITVTEADAGVLRAAGHTGPITVVPNIHVPEAETPGWESREGLIFVGNFNHPPNISAVLWLVREIMPKVRALVPGTCLSIIGPNPPAEVMALAGADVVVLGWVPETAVYLDAARVSVAPLLVGAGMKGKVGEALGRGLPVVSTTIGAEGMGLENGRQVLIADDPEGFAQAVARLLQDRDTWELLACEGRSFIDSAYGVGAVGKILRELVQPTRSVQSVSPGDPRISLVVNTRNEGSNLEGLFASCQGVDEIVVADMESSDRTLEIAQAHGARILPLANAGCCEPGRQQALDAASGDWILVLDADERLPPGAIARLRQLAAGAPRDAGGYSLPFNIYLGGTQVRATGWEARYERHPRFFRKGKVRWPSRVHAVPVIEGDVLEIPTEDLWVDHFNFADLGHFIEKVNRYSGIEADEMLALGQCPSVIQGLTEGLGELLRRYSPEEDGAMSLALSLGMMLYKVLDHAKAAERAGWEAEDLPTREALARAVAAFTCEISADTQPMRPLGARADGSGQNPAGRGKITSGVS